MGWFRGLPFLGKLTRELRQEDPNMWTVSTGCQCTIYTVPVSRYNYYASI
jgi:hypothetical protein